MKGNKMENKKRTTIQNKKDCRVTIKKENGLFYLLISQNDGYHCQCAELTQKQANKLSKFIGE